MLGGIDVSGVGYARPSRVSCTSLPSTVMSPRRANSPFRFDVVPLVGATPAITATLLKGIFSSPIASPCLSAPSMRTDFSGRRSPLALSSVRTGGGGWKPFSASILGANVPLVLSNRGAVTVSFACTTFVSSVRTLPSSLTRAC